MASQTRLDSPERLKRRRELRQQTVEKHRLLRRLGDEEAALVAQLAQLREESVDPTRSVGERAKQQAEAEERLAAVRDETSRTREQAAAVKLEAAGLCSLEATREPPAAEEPVLPGSPGDLLARRAMSRTNEAVHHEIGADMRAFLRRHPTGTVEEWAAQSEWASDTGGARDERGLSLRVRQGDWKRLFDVAASGSEPAGAALKQSGGSQLRPLVGRQYRCLLPTAATSELDADPADPTLSFQQLDPGVVVLCEESAESIDGRHRLRCEHGWISLVSMGGQQLLEELPPQSKFGLLQKALRSQVDIVRAEAKAMLDLESKPDQGLTSEPQPEPQPAAHEAKAVLSGLGGSFMRMLSEITEKPSSPPASSTQYDNDWRTRVPGRKPRQLPSSPLGLQKKQNPCGEGDDRDNDVEDHPPSAETSRNGVVLWRCVAAEPVRVRSAEAGLDERDGEDHAGRKPIWLADPLLFRTPVGTAGCLVWPGQVIKGRQRAASSWVRGRGDGRVLRLPRCVEILDASGDYNGSWVPLFDEEEDQIDDSAGEEQDVQGILPLFRSLAAESSARMAPAPPRRGLAAVRMAAPSHSRIGMKDVVFWNSGPLGLHFAKVAGGIPERARPMEVTAVEEGGAQQTICPPLALNLTSLGGMS